MLLDEKVQLLQVIAPVGGPHTGHDVVWAPGCVKRTMSSELQDIGSLLSADMAVKLGHNK